MRIHPVDCTLVSKHIGCNVVYNCPHYWHTSHDLEPNILSDLEFNKHFNPKLTPTKTEQLLAELFTELCRQFQLIYTINIERHHMVDLESSTVQKFSRHWILHLPNGELFSDAREVGVFVKVFVSRLEEEEKSGELQSRGHELLANNLFVNAEMNDNDGNNNTKMTRFIDLGVYTRNRIFRLLGSNKFGKTPDAALRIADANTFPFSGFDNTKFYLPTMKESSEDITAATNDDKSDPDAENDDEEDFKSFCESLSWENHAVAMAATLVVPANASKMDYPILDDPSSLLSDDEKQQYLSIRLSDGTGSYVGISRFPRKTTSYGTSPLPKLESFVLNTLGKRKGLIGSIGTWSLDSTRPLPQTIAFNMKDNRWCDNAGRAHKSNNIIWNIHLIDRICYQSCHDPECHGFRGEPIDLPEEVNLDIDEYFLECEISTLNENVANGQLIDGEFDDPTLEAAMQQLDISNVAPKIETGADLDDEALDDELAKLNLSDIIASTSGSSDGKDQAVIASS